MRTLVSLDLETTGLDAERDAILEIGVVKFRGEEVLEEWNAVIDPGRPIPPKITELTGITHEMVTNDGIALFDGLREAARISGALPIVGHNIQFDLAFLRRQRTLEKNPAIDTFELARRQCRLEQIGCIERATRGRARANQCVYFVYKQDRVRVFQ